MPSLADHPSQTLVKMLVASPSGTGKTGGMASLVDAGYRLRVLDFDMGVSTLRGYIKNKQAVLDGAVQYLPLRDELMLAGARVGIKNAPAFPKAMDALNGKGWDDDPGPATSWGPKDVLVVDTLSGMGKSSLYMVMNANAAGMKAPEIQHYGVAMDNLEKFLGIITSDTIPCNVLVNTHVAGDDSGKLFPESLGSKLNPKVGKYFDNMITISTAGGKKQYKTKQDGAFACKTAIPLADTFPLETGLADIFKKLMEG